jgi:hypothetical protein
MTFDVVRLEPTVGPKSCWDSPGQPRLKRRTNKEQNVCGVGGRCGRLGILRFTVSGAAERLRSLVGLR